MRRWGSGPTWIPADCMPLVRHRSLDGRRRIVTNDRTPPEGFVIEYDLGLVHRVAQLGTRRLIASKWTGDIGQSYLCSAVEGCLDSDYEGLGYVEEAPLPMLDALELRRDAASREHVLVAGVDDPLYSTAAPVAVIGFIEGYPILPRHPPHQAIDWSIATLLRQSDPVRWLHHYRVSEKQVPGAVSLGGLWTRPGSAFVALHLHEDGLLTSELLPVPPPRTSPLNARLRWAAAPLTWQRRPRAWAARAAASRLKTLGVKPSSRFSAASGSSLVGYLKREPSPGWSPLFSATHPALADQYVTRSELEATDMGYRVMGVLGYILDRYADRSREALPAEVKWASRFGQQRRYVEGAWPQMNRLNSSARDTAAQACST
jgi:hypothetical protein